MKNIYIYFLIISRYLHHNLLILFNNVLCYYKAMNIDGNKWLFWSVETYVFKKYCLWTLFLTKCWKCDLDCRNKDWFQKTATLNNFLLYQSPNLPQRYHPTCLDFYSSWSCIEWWSGDIQQVTHERCQVPGDRCQVTFLDFTTKKMIFWYWCYYPYTSRDSVPPVCGIFLTYSNIFP